MSFNIEVTGMVLSATPVGDYDKRLVIMTKERGKITAFAKGAKRPTSSLMACSQPFVYGKFSVYEGRNAYTLTGCQVSEYFVELRNDLQTVSYGLYFCELAGYYVRENQREEQILSLMYMTMKALVDRQMDCDMIRAVCELKMAAISGEAPYPCDCVVCHTKENLTGISFDAGGGVCKEHEKNYKDVCHMEMSAIYAVYYVYRSAPDKVYHFRLEEGARIDFIHYMKRYMGRFVSYEFKSEKMLGLSKDLL